MPANVVKGYRQRLISCMSCIQAGETLINPFKLITSRSAIVFSEGNLGAFMFVPAYVVTIQMTLLSSVGVPTSVASVAVTIHIPHYSSAESRVSLTTDLSPYNSIKIGVRRVFNMSPGVCFYSTIRGGPPVHNDRYSSSVTHPLHNYRVAI